MTATLFNARSKFGKEIRLTKTTWEKIVRDHPEFKQCSIYQEQIIKTIMEPEYIVEGWAGELLALKWSEITPRNPKYLCVVYRELNNDGFVITAFFISRYGKLLRRKVVWQKGRPRNS